MTAMRSRLLEPARGSFFLFGPRGTGKSTWLRERFPEAPRIDLLDEARYHRLVAHPGLLGDELRALPRGSTVVVDEVQRIPALLNEVHRAIEARRQRFVLCGSSARKLKTAGTNLLAGRAVRRSMHPFVPEELGDDFDLATALRFGTLPVVWSAPDRAEALQAYVQMYLREEIQAEALVRSLGGFARFLPVAALLHGQVVNVSNVAREAGVARTTVVGYLDVLEDTLLAFRLPGFESRLRVRERRHPKLYWADPGLPRAVASQLGPPAPEERGRLFEGLVAQTLRAYRDYRGLFEDWWYWSPLASPGFEVDFVLRRGRDYVAVETKSRAEPPHRPHRGLRAVGELPGMRRRVLVHPSGRRLVTADGVEVLPFRDFLSDVEGGTLFP
jgi:predicted AAA+ superfamily ATPase